MSSLPLQNVKLLWKLFYINICGFRTNFYTRSDLTIFRFKVQLPTSDSIEITAGGPKITLGGPVPLDAPSGKNVLHSEYFTISNSVFNVNFLFFYTVVSGGLVSSGT